MSTELVKVVDEIASTFEEYKNDNNARLEKLEKNEGVAEITEKLERMDQGLDDLAAVKEKLELIETKHNREIGLSPDEQKAMEHREAFRDFMIKGNEDGIKAVNLGVDADGGHAVPEIIDTQIYQLLRDASPMRQVCTVKQVPADYKELVNLGVAAVGGWGGETTAPTETNTPQLAELSPKLAELWCEPRSTQWALEDMTLVDVEAWLSSEVAIAFAERENLDFTTGDNAGNTPQGLFSGTTATTDDDVRAFGTFQHVAAAGTAAVTSDELIDTLYSLRAVYRTNARWMMNRLTQRDIRKLTDGQNNYLWQPGYQNDQPATLLGYPIIENEDCEDLATGVKGIAFGDYARGYVIADRRGVRVVRDELTTKPYIKFWTTKRTGSYVRDTNAIKFIQQA